MILASLDVVFLLEFTLEMKYGKEVSLIVSSCFMEFFLFCYIS